MTTMQMTLRLMLAVRQGQPLGALLGHQLEQGMHTAALDAFIQPLRDRLNLQEQLVQLVTQRRSRPRRVRDHDGVEPVPGRPPAVVPDDPGRLGGQLVPAVQL